MDLSGLTLCRCSFVVGTRLPLLPGNAHDSVRDMWILASLIVVVFLAPVVRASLLVQSRQQRMSAWIRHAVRCMLCDLLDIELVNCVYEGLSYVSKRAIT